MKQKDIKRDRDKTIKCSGCNELFEPEKIGNHLYIDGYKYCDSCVEYFYRNTNLN